MIKIDYLTKPFEIDVVNSDQIENGQDHKTLLSDITYLSSSSSKLSPSSSSSSPSSPKISTVTDILPKGEEGNSELLTFFLMLNAMIGSGILNQPKVFEAAGLGAALIMFTVAAVFIWLSLVVTIECGIFVGKYDYSELAKHIFGEKGEYIVDIAIVLGNYGALISYLDIIGGTSSDLFYSWGCASAGGCSFYATTTIFVFVFILPVCSMRYFGHLAIYSVFSMTAIVSCLVLVVIAGPIVGSGGGVNGFVGGGITQLGSIVFTLNCTFAAFHSYKSMKDASLEKWKRIAIHVVIVGYFLCCSMGIAGSLSFGNSVDGIILDNFAGHYADFFKILLIIHLILYIPVEFMVMRNSLIKMTFNKKGVISSFPGHFTLTFVMLFIASLIILLLRSAGVSQGNAFSLVLDFTGAITGSIISFILPGAFYLKIHQRKDEYFYPCAIMFILGILVMIVVPILSVLSITG